MEYSISARNNRSSVVSASCEERDPVHQLHRIGAVPVHEAQNVFRPDTKGFTLLDQLLLNLLIGKAVQVAPTDGNPIRRTRRIDGAVGVLKLSGRKIHYLFGHFPKSGQLSARNGDQTGIGYKHLIFSRYFRRTLSFLTDERP